MKDLKLRLSPYHKIFYNEWKLNPNSSAYNIVFDQTLSQTLNIERLENALYRFIEEHLIFNSHILEENEEVYWILNDKIKLLDKFESDEGMYEYVSSSFDLNIEPLYRFAIFKQEVNYRLILVLHHILIDGNSFDEFISLISSYYNDIKHKNPENSNQQAEKILKITDSVYSKLEKVSTIAKQFWQTKLADTEVIDLRFLKSNITAIEDNKTNSSLIREINFNFSEKIINRLQKINLNISIYAYSQIIFATLISRYSSQVKFGLAYPIAIKEYLGLNTGSGINTNLCFYDIQSSTTIADLIIQQQQFIKEVKQNNYNYMPINEIANNDNKRILDIILAQTNLKDLPYSFTNVEVISISRDFEFDLPVKLSFGQQLKNGILKFQVKYNIQEIDEEILNQFIFHYKKLFMEVIADLEQNNLKKPISEYQILTPEEYQKIVYDWNNTAKLYPCDKTIHQLFEEQVEKTPNNIAIVYEDVQFTYQELNIKANQLANYILDNYEINADDLVILFLERSEQMAIAMLGILKAGAAYVPIDVKSPSERIKYVLEDTKTKLLITNDKYEDKFKKNNFLNVIAINNTQIEQELLLQSQKNPSVAATANNLAYMIYTSGTTGKPKGVLIEHKSVVNFAIAMSNYLFTNNNHIYKFLWFANYTFDAHVLELYPTISTGNQVFVLSEETIKNLGRLEKYISDNQIEIALIPPALLSYLEILNLKTLIVGGEKTNPSIIDQYYNKGIRIINAYGPTEDTVCTTLNFYNRNGYSNIGRPIYNKQVYVLDNTLNPIPIGAIGQLYIGGDGVARGYLNRSDITQKSFIQNPFQTKTDKEQNKNNWLYKTGDLVRYLVNGDIEYIGRKDTQVKVRGFRIELSEIENTLLEFKEIKQAVVVARQLLREDDKNPVQSLIAYYVSDTRLNETSIYNYLLNNLPHYMLPAVIIHLTKLPLTKNGKIDYINLPIPELLNSVNYIAPRTDLEFAICKIYAEILNIQDSKIGIRDDFFNLGGNSILIIKLAALLNKKLNIKVGIENLFKARTIELLANNLADKETPSINKALPINKKFYTLSFAQERLWFIEQYRKGSNAYNIPLLFKLSDSCKEKVLFSSLRAIIKRHEILRTIIRVNNNGQVYQEVKHPKIEIEDNKAKSKAHLRRLIKQEINYIFKLDREIPIRICLYYYQKDRYLSILIHHIAFDGWSLDILLKELIGYYTYYNKTSSQMNYTKPFSTLKLQYKDFASWQRNYFSIENLKLQFEYWKKQLNGYQVLNLPTDKVRTNNINYNGSSIYFCLGHELSNKLRELAKELHISLFSVLLAGYYLFLRAYANQDDIVIGVPIANRHYPQIENLIGFFVNTLALRSIINGEANLIDYLKQVGRDVINGQLNQDLPFEKLVEGLGVDKNTLIDNPIFQIMFSVQRFGMNIDKDCHSDIFSNYDLEINVRTAKFDITTVLDDSETNIRGVFNYIIGLYEVKTIENYIRTYKYILKQIANLKNKKYSGLKIKNLSYITDYDYIKLFHTEAKKPGKNHKGYQNIHQLFEEQVQKTPNNIALIYEDKKFTYNIVNKMANQLASYLLNSKNTNPDKNGLIALYLDRNEYLLIAILAVLKSGKAYVPIDPNHPNQRIKYILSEVKPELILTSDVGLNKLKEFIADGLSIEYFFTSISHNYEANNLPIVINSDNLAYVMYTSGTTGKPKGIMMQHLSCINRIIEMVNISQINENDRVLFKTSYTFDVSFSDIFTTLSVGACLVMTKNTFDIEEILEILNRYSITVCHFTPSQFNIIKTLYGTQIFNYLRVLHFSGEALNPQLLTSVNENVKCINYYGPTETGEVTFEEMMHYSNQINTPTIGYPIGNVSLFILNNDGSMVPKGAVGELYIGGISLAKGYFSQIQLTSERFISNQLLLKDNDLAEKNRILYKTGDLVRYRLNGNLEYMGRNDFQVKIRGFRIELTEIENVLLKTNYIKQAAVILLDDKYLVAYCVADKKLIEDEIKEQLSLEMPDHMIPQQIIQLDRFPLTVNGKLDLTSLPKPEWVNKNSYIKPNGDLEKMVCNLYAEILGLPKGQIGLNDDFFKLGGNSISTISLAIRLQHHFKITVSDIFRLRTPAKIIKYTPYAKGNLISKLEHIKSLYSRKRNLVKDREKMALKYNEYIEKADKFAFKKQKKNIYNVLLTGTTGHVGCHILYQLLRETEYKIYLLTRGNSDDHPYKRVKDKFEYYFGASLDEFKDRIVTFSSDLENPKLSINEICYQELINNVDTIIHAAALVKHYGEYEKSYQANCQATVNLLELCMLTKGRDFHYISTIAIFYDGYKPNHDYYEFSEFDDGSDICNRTSAYVRTKYEGELIVKQYRQRGITSNIYRLGNVVVNTNTQKFQSDIEDNAFFTKVKTILNIGIIAKEIDEVEITPVEYAALAIIKIFDKKCLNNMVYHIFNPYKFKLSELFINNSITHVKMCTINRFINDIINILNTKIDNKQIELFLLHQLWLQDIDNIVKVKVLQYQTDSILSKLGFFWPKLSDDIFSSILKQALKDKVVNGKNKSIRGLREISNSSSTFILLDR